MDAQLEKLRKKFEGGRGVENAAGLSPRQLLILIDVALFPGTIQARLAERQHIHKSHVSRLVFGMDTSGGPGDRGAHLIERRSAHRSRSMQRLHLTPKGTRVLNKLVGE